MRKFRKYLILYLLFFIAISCFGQSEKTIKIVDKQLVVNSSLEYKAIEKYLQATWDSLDQVGQAWVNDFQKQYQNPPCFAPSLSADQLKLLEERLNQAEQVIYRFADFRSDTCLMIGEEIKALAFDIILENFYFENSSKNIVLIDKSQILYFDESLDMTEMFQEFVLSKRPSENIHENSLFGICQIIFEKYKLEEKLSLKCPSLYNRGNFNK